MCQAITSRAAEQSQAIYAKSQTVKAAVYVPAFA